MEMAEYNSSCYWTTPDSRAEMWGSGGVRSSPNPSIRSVVFTPSWLLGVYLFYGQTIHSSPEWPQSTVVLGVCFKGIFYPFFPSLFYADSFEMGWCTLPTCSTAAALAVNSSSDFLPSWIIEVAESLRCRFLHVLQHCLQPCSLFKFFSFVSQR